MKFMVGICDKNFVADEKLFDRELKSIEFGYHFSKQAFLCLGNLDNKEAREYVVSRVSEFIPNLYAYDIGKDETSLRDFSDYVKKQPTILYNLEDYYLRVMKEKNISLEKAKELVFEGINMTRDSVFLENNANFILLLSDVDFYHFMVSADDFFSYCYPRVDFNSCFVDENGVSLRDYYKEENEKKVFRK